MTESEWHGSRTERLEQLIQRSKSGDLTARRQMEAFIYKELYRLASTYMQRERHNHTLAVTGLVHETITRIAGDAHYADQHHFYATAARIMRNVLVDYAKARRAAKRGGPNLSTQPLTEAMAGTAGGIDVVEVDEMLERLTTHSPSAAHAFELHYFAGLNLQETARLMDTSPTSVKRLIRFAKAWLLAQLQGQGASSLARNAGERGDRSHEDQ